MELDSACCKFQGGGEVKMAPVRGAHAPVIFLFSLHIIMTGNKGSEL